MKKLSTITERFTESVIREMTRRCIAVNGYNLSQGIPEFEPPDEVKNAAIEAIMNNQNQYPITFGQEQIRKEIAYKSYQYNNIVCDPNTEVTVTCGSTESMFCTLKAIVNKGDEIIIFEPFYENYGPDAMLTGAKLKYVTLYPPNWEYDLSELKKAFSNKTKAIIINTPNNPTGKVFSKKELEEIADLCITYDSFCITDEIYEHIIYDGKKHISMASLEGMLKRTITINSISKTYSLTGWRVGWAIAKREITERIRKVHDFLTVGAPTPFQNAAVIALKMPKEYYNLVRKYYNDARNYLFNTLKEFGFNPYLPHGAYYIIAETDELMKKYGIIDDYNFSMFLLEKTRVATVPGSSFYATSDKGKNKVRFSFCKKKSTLEDVRNCMKVLLK